MSERIRVIMAALLASMLLLPVPLVGTADETQRRDPLQPPPGVQQDTGPAFNADAWKLTSTLVAEGRRVAIINDHDVRVGDRVGGARVLAIETGRVRLQYRDREFTITRPAVRVRLNQ